MGYHDIYLTYAAKKVFTITTPFGSYKYKRLQMGVWIALDMFRYQMSALKDNLEFVRVYLDNLLVITFSLVKEHLSKV